MLWVWCQCDRHRELLVSLPRLLFESTKWEAFACSKFEWVTFELEWYLEKRTFNLWRDIQQMLSKKSIIRCHNWFSQQKQKKILSILICFGVSSYRMSKWRKNCPSKSKRMSFLSNHSSPLYSYSTKPAVLKCSKLMQWLTPTWRWLFNFPETFILNREILTQEGYYKGSALK